MTQMNEALELLQKKLEATDENDLDTYRMELERDFGISQVPEEEAGLVLNSAVSGELTEDELYKLFYKFIEFYESNDEYLHSFANIVIFGVAEGIVNPIDGSRLVGSLWAKLGYPDDLVEFIGTEGELEFIENQLKEGKLSADKMDEYYEKIKKISNDLKEIAADYVEKHT